MKIGLIGAGRLGICLALLIEDAGYEVIASDTREDYIKDLQKGKIDTTEPRVQEYLTKATKIEFTTDNDKVILESDIIYTLVATPSLEDGSYDVSNVDDVVGDFQRLGWSTTGSNGSGLTGKSLVIGCTTNPGDCDVFQRRLMDDGVDVYYNPEFIAQGSIIKDLQYADMVLIGGNGHHVSVLENIYHKIQLGFQYPSIHFMSTKAAELTKIAVNCFLTTKISYANMIGQVLSKSNMDDEIDNVLKAIGADDRIGQKYLKFGFGFGGPCFPRDNRAFAAYATQVGVEHNIGTTTDNFNNSHAEFLRDHYVSKNPNKDIPFYFDYISYKKGTDILVESQQFKLCKDLINLGYVVYINDIPDVIDKVKDQFDERVVFVNEDTVIPSKIYYINLP